jgi:hypothetical protein
LRLGLAQDRELVFLGFGILDRVLSFFGVRGLLILAGAILFCGACARASDCSLAICLSRSRCSVISFFWSLKALI